MFTVIADTDCRTEGRALGDELVHLRRTLVHRHGGTKLEVFGAAWCLVLGRHTRAGQITARCEGDSVSFLLESASFFPPFSIVEWHFTPGEITIDCFLSTHSLPCDLPRHPVAFRPRATKPRSVAQCFELVRTGTHDVDLRRVRRPNAVAERTKALIDRTYTTDISILQLASRLGFPYSTMVRAFREAYGIPPVRYRTKLRVWKALERLCLGHTLVTTAAFDSGFQNLGQFYRQFRREIPVSPSQLHV